MARFEGCHQQTEIRENRREEANNSGQGTMRRFSRWVVTPPIASPLSMGSPIEEFGIYLNYVRKLGFEETPDYEFLKELFMKIMKNNGDIDDGVFDWNLLNGEQHRTIFLHFRHSYPLDRRQRMGGFRGQYCRSRS
jgi:hypothetical protein